jgi:sugar/nucleoside kinase (ribokinase family)
LAALGRPAALLARFGTDELSSALGKRIEQLGLDLQFLDRHPTAGPQLTVVMVQDGERAFLSRRAGHARPASFEKALAWSAATHLHIAEYATLHEMTDAIGAAKRHGLTVSLDPSWDDTLIREPKFLEHAAGADIFLPNLEEAEALTGLADPAAALGQLASEFPIVALKCGGEGALPSRLVEVIDTTGAGDAFNAGFLHCWLNGATLADCLAAAIDAGTRSVQALGGTGSLRTHLK